MKRFLRSVLAAGVLQVAGVVPVAAQMSCPAAPSNTCVYSSDFSRLQMHANTFLWKYRRGNFLQSDGGDPVNATNFAVCIYQDQSLVRTMQVPHGGQCRSHTCWSQLGDRGLAYRNPDINADGIHWVKIKYGEKKAIMKVKGRGPNLALPLPMTVTTAVTMQLHNSDGKCWEAVFPVPAKRQGPEDYADSTSFLTGGS